MTCSGTFTTLDGCSIAYFEDGDSGAPPVLLSNSLGATSAMWRKQVPMLTAHFRVLTYDMRGHGRSGVPTGAYSLDRLGRDAIELLDHLAIDRAHFCGVSLGGMTGQWLAAHAPARVHRVILAHTSAHMPPASNWQERIAQVLEEGVGVIAEAVVERWVTPSFKAERAREFAELVDAVSAVDPVGYAGCCAAIRDMDLRPLASTIAADCLIVAGLNDPATPLSHSEFLAATIARARLVTTSGAHLSNLESVSEFNSHLLSELLRN